MVLAADIFRGKIVSLSGRKREVGNEKDEARNTIEFQEIWKVSKQERKSQKSGRRF